MFSHLLEQFALALDNYRSHLKHTYIHTQSRTHTDTHRHPHTHTHTHIFTPTHAQTQTPTYTHIHIHARTHIHTIMKKAQKCIKHLGRDANRKKKMSWMCLASTVERKRERERERERVCVCEIDRWRERKRQTKRKSWRDEREMTMMIKNDLFYFSILQESKF